ncbi:MAG: hypothetical protein HY559_03570 [Gammaproteobacteria bacterium]|nr:hypothetical protein [Gammaproteobacteria bacterium]
MHTLINAKVLRMTLPEIVHQVQHGKKFTVLYRSRPAFNIVPPDEKSENVTLSELSKDALYHAQAVGYTRRGGSALRHDDILYGKT